MGLRTALSDLVDRAVSRVFAVLIGSAPEPNTISLEEAIDIYDQLATEAEELATDSNVEDKSLPEESEVALAVAPPPVDCHTQERAIQALMKMTFDGTFTSRQFVGWHVHNWRNVPASIWAAALQYLEDHPDFSDKVDAGEQWWQSVPSNDPVVTLDSLRPDKRVLSRKQVRKLPRPRPKDQNPVYKVGAQPPQSWTLEGPEQIDKMLREMQQNQSTSASEALLLAESQKIELQKWFEARMAQQDQVIDGLRRSAENWKSASEKKMPKRDEKGRFVKG